MKKKKSIKVIRALRTVLLIIMSMVLGIGIYSWNAKSLTGNSMPMPFGIGIAVVLSGSMEPDMSVNDMIIVRSCSDYTVGDVVVYQDAHAFVVHKIIQRDGDLVITKGTANDSPDDPVDITRIKGKVVCTVPGLGSLITVIKSPVATFALLGAATFLLILSYRRERQDDDEQLALIRAEIQRLKNMPDQDG